MRYAILADIHANAEALSAVEADVKAIRLEDEEAGRASTQYWFLGDLVGYGPEPVPCLKWLRVRSGIEQRWVPGNHDEYLQSGHIPGNIHADAQQTLQAHLTTLNEPRYRRDRDWFLEQVRAYVQDQRPSLVFETEGELTAGFTHAATPPSMRRTHYLFPWKLGDLEIEFQHLRLESPATETTVLFCGHTHYPMWVKEGEGGQPVLQSIRYGQPTPLGRGLMIINPGSVGQPRDGDPRAAYVILDMGAQTIEFRRVSYAIDETVRHLWAIESIDDAIRKNLANRLETANGGEKLELFKTAYRRPTWDLEAINNGGL